MMIKLDKKIKWNKISRDKIEKKTSKSIKNKTNIKQNNETKIEVNNNWMTYLIFRGPNTKIKMWREKREVKRKNIHRWSITPPPFTRIIPSCKVQHIASNTIADGDIWTLRGATHTVQIMGAPPYWSVQLFYFLFIFIYF